MTTSQYRQQATEFEKSLQWGYALDAWQNAIDHYPVTNPGKNTLAALDLEKMESRRIACQAMYFPA